MIIKTYKIFSLCEDFNSDTYPLMYDNLSGEYSPDSYIDYQANSKTYLEDNGFTNDIVANRLIDLGCGEGEEVLIHIDY